MNQDQTQVTIRTLSEDDHESVARLAQLDSSREPQGHLLGAVVDGRLVAALSMTSGESIANPFTPSDEARSMLELRAKQLNPRRRRILRRRNRRQGSLGAQPAGAGGRLI